MAASIPAQSTMADAALNEIFRKSRSGARAARGFHYQDFIGTWLASRMLSKEEHFTRVVPEGLEDISCAGAENLHVQVKSKMREASSFTVAEVATVVAEIWAKEAKRREAGSQRARLALVIERSIEGQQLDDWSSPISANPAELGILSAVLPKIAEHAWDPGFVDELAELTVVVVLPWEEAAKDTAERLATLVDAPMVVGRLIARGLREELAAAADSNADSDTLEAASGVDLQTATLSMQRTLALTATEHLQRALTSGICEILDFSGRYDARTFYEGTASQPGHVGMGLPTERDDITIQIADATSRGRPVLLVGPSGVGKSTALWGAAHRLNHVTWYRVNRLEIEHVQPLIDLAEGSLPTMASPVGLLVDGIDDHLAPGWDELVRAAGRIPGLVLIGTARAENLLPIRALADCERIDVELTESMAERIHATLLSLNLTPVQHWREAYELAGGLTLEYAHFLYSGRRLGDVLGEQVATRVRESRDVELSVLALVTTSHQWDAALTIDSLARMVSGTAQELRTALARLNEEHLVTSDATHVAGLHALRSRTLSEIVHRYPPPDIASTVRSLIEHANVDSLGKVVRGSLIDFPTMESVVVEAAQKRIKAQSEPRVANEVLAALRTADLTRQSTLWRSILLKHGVAKSLWLTTLTMSMTAGDISLPLKPGVSEAIPELQAALARPSTLLGSFAAGLDAGFMLSVLTKCESSTEAARLLSNFSGANLSNPFGNDVDLSCTPLGDLLANDDLTSLGELLAVARTVDATFAQTLFDAAGGEEAMLTRIAASSPWLTRAAVETRPDGPVPFMRVAHISEDLQGSPDEYARDLARLALRLFPQCEMVDVAAVFPGGAPISVGNYTAGVSLLKRRYDHSSLEVVWNRRRVAIAANTFGAPTATERVYQAVQLCDEAAEFLADVARIWVTGLDRPSNAPPLVARMERLEALALDLVVPAGAISVSEDSAPAPPSDALSALLDGIVHRIVGRLADQTQWRPLVAYLGDSLRRNVLDVRREEKWYLLDSHAPDSLRRIEETLGDLHAVLAERSLGNTAPKTLTTAARSGASERALGRAADVARRAARSRHSRAWRDLQLTLDREGVVVDTATRESESGSSVLWPYLDVALGIRVTRVSDWYEKLQIVLSHLQSDIDATARTNGIVVLPMFEKGTPACQVLKVTSSVTSAAESAHRWTDLVREEIPTPTHDSVQICLEELRKVSAVISVESPSDLVEAQRVCDESVSEFGRQFRYLEALEPRGSALSALLEYLCETAERVQGEADGDFDGDTTYNSLASEILDIALAGIQNQSNTGNEQASPHVLALATALQLDIDPDVADEMVS